MTSLIKAREGSAEVRAVDWADAAETPVRAVPRAGAAPSPALARLEQEIESLQARLAAAEARHRQELAAKIEEARKEAMAAHRRRDEDALAALKDSLAESAGEAIERMGDAERLALLLCNAALETVFSDAGALKDLVARAMKRQVEQLRSELILGARVSRSDFPDPASLQALQRVLGAHVEIKADPDLAAGACRLDLRLGHIELSLPEHWRALQAELRRLAHAEARS